MKVDVVVRAVSRAAPAELRRIAEHIAAVVRAVGAAVAQWVTRLMGRLCTFDFADEISSRLGKTIKEEREQSWPDVITDITAPGWGEGAESGGKTKRSQEPMAGTDGYLDKFGDGQERAFP